MTRKRNIKLDSKNFDTVDTGAKKEKSIDTYQMTLKHMTKGTIQRYRFLREQKLIAETNFSKFVDNLILDKLAELEAIERTRKI